MVHLPSVVFARHSETLDWYLVILDGNPSIDHRFQTERVDFGKVAFTHVPEDFTPTHIHYKGHGYRRYGLAYVLEPTEVYVTYVLYGDAEGNYWLRPREMFEGNLDDGTVRFTPVTA